MASAAYTSEHITVLEGLEPVRRRPGMYIGGTDTKGYHHLLWEIVDNSVDEVINGFATHIHVTLHKDAKSVTVVDDGRGIPVDVKKEFKKSALELVLTTLHAGGKPSSKLRKVGSAKGTGTSIMFRPDPQIFGAQQFSSETIRFRLDSKAFLHKGLKITYRDEAAGTTDVFEHAGGIADFLARVVTDRAKPPTAPQVFYFERE